MFRSGGVIVSTKVTFKNKVLQILILPVIALFLDKTFLSEPAEQTGWAVGL